ncbi:MAG: pseudouridine synthase [Candidatus Izemoplasmatales bacterium]|jgi:16S rRNA pseudouridine516 synthase|nr:pseudouridine synthase [Candidatus Izemoplasmatales bacterium]
MRIDKFLSNLKFGSRKEVHELVKKGYITVNGVVISDFGLDISPALDQIIVGEETVYYQPSITLMMNKPKGVVSANTDLLDKTVIDLIEIPFARFDFNIAGRLDKDTEGLLILTTDGSMLHQIISPSKEVYKTYLVELRDPLTRTEELENGVVIKDGKNMDFTTKPCFIKQINEKVATIKILEGKFHQVKRMFEAIENEVVALKRIAIGELPLDDNLLPGEVKELSQVDILNIFR